MAMAAVVPSPKVDARRRGPLVLLLGAVAAVLVLSFRSQTAGTGAAAPLQDAFVGGAAPAVNAVPAQSLTTRHARPLVRPIDFGESVRKIWAKEKKLKYDGATKAQYLRRLRWRREMSRSPYPRRWGYVEAWDDRVGEGLIRDQEYTKKLYLVIRDEIGRCYQNYKTLQRAEFVEFFATDEIDEEKKLPLARNVTGPLGEYVKGSEEYRIRMLRKGNFPKRWADNEEEYPNRVGQYYLKRKWRNQ
jgi:hypothetical protein